MDKVRMVLGWLKRHHFWLLLVLVALIAVVCWWSASGKAIAGFNTAKSTITAGFSEIESVQSASFHPNSEINKRQTEENAKQQESVQKLWQFLYEKQRADVLKWPVALSQAFRDFVEKKQFGDNIPEDLRDNYQNYIEQHFPKLPEKINARALDINNTSGAGAGAYGGGEYSRGPGAYGPGAYGAAGATGMPDDDDYICEWSFADQQVIRDELNFPQRPSALRIWVTQEDLWVYHTLLNVIAKTNQAVNATRKSNAAIQAVSSIEVGSRAAQYSRSPGRLLVAPVTAAGGGVEGPGAGARGPGPGMGMAPGGRGEERGMGMGPGMGMSLAPGSVLTPAQEQGMLMSGRYIDDKGQPIAVGGGDAAAGAPAPEASAPAAAEAPPLDMSQFGAGYKRLPIRMVLRMDVRKLPILITACANEPLRVEVQEVRINPSDASATNGGMMGGMMGGYGGERGGPGGGGGYRPSGMMGGGSPGASLFPDRTGIQTFLARPYEATVVVQGIIYIFKKPELNKAKPAGEQPVATAN